MPGVQRLVIVFFVLLCFSCKKEYSCEGCVPGAGNPLPPPAPNPQGPVIASLNCNTGSFSLSAVEATPYSGDYAVDYTGGNGASYKADTIQSTGVAGLTAVLPPGTLANGNGKLVFHISGTPAAAGNASFAISFAGKNCTATLSIDAKMIVVSGIIKMPIAVEKERNLVIVNGKVKAWGHNQFGQLGDGTTANRDVPVEVNTLKNIAAVAAGGYHSLALGIDGKVWAWGRNERGQLGDGTLNENHAPKLINSLSNIISIAAGFDYSLALKNDGTVWAWGSNLWGVLGDGTFNDRYQPIQVTNLTDIIAIAAGTEHCLALKKDGTVWAWGWNANGALGDGSTVIKRSVPAPIPSLSGITAIAANGSSHSITLKNDGTVWTWGENFYGQLGDGSFVEKLVPMRVASLANVVAIGTGERHSFAIKNDGSLWAWGWNGNGQLGTDFTFSTSEVIPIRVTLLSDVTRVAGGSFHSLAQKSNGTIYTMGNNVFGQLGNGSNVVNRYTPALVPGL